MKALYCLMMPVFLAGCTLGVNATKEIIGPSEGESASTVSRTLPTTLEEAVNSQYRSDENRKRDQYRRPFETLEFFGVDREMTVVEVSPGTGWYTEILAPYLSEDGRYIAAVVPPGDRAYLQNLLKQFNAWVEERPELNVTITQFDPANGVEVAPAESADMVLTFRNIHGWQRAGITDAAFASFYKALKPGGVLGVVQHRGAEGVKLDPEVTSGYVPESEVIRIAEKAGFQLAAKSEINANPKDTRDHPNGVWSLPPSLREGDVDRDKYLAIGESDRMTLRFRKPASDKSAAKD